LQWNSSTFSEAEDVQGHHRHTKHIADAATTNGSGFDGDRLKPEEKRRAHEAVRVCKANETNLKKINVITLLFG
jgi:hypothetical protein